MRLVIFGGHWGLLKSPSAGPRKTQRASVRFANAFCVLLSSFWVVVCSGWLYSIVIYCKTWMLMGQHSGFCGGCDVGESLGSFCLVRAL